MLDQLLFNGLRVAVAVGGLFVVWLAITSFHGAATGKPDDASLPDPDHPVRERFARVGIGLFQLLFGLGMIGGAWTAFLPNP